MIANLDVVGYNYNLATHHEEDHRRAPSRIMMTTESFPKQAFTEWRLAHDHPYILGEFVWTAMDYLGESGIGSWAYAAPEVAEMADKAMSGMQGMVDQMFLAMANGVDMTALLSQGAPQGQGAASPMSLMFPGFPWHMAFCGDIDLIGQRKPQSYYRDILWNGGDRVYATVRLPEPDGQKIAAPGWAVFPTVPSWTWPGREGKAMQVEVYSGVEKVRLLLNDKLIGEKPTGREQEFRAVFEVPYTPGVLKAVGVKGDRDVAESVLATASRPARLRLSADRVELSADGQDLSFILVEAVDAQGRLWPMADQEVEFGIDGPGVIAAVGNADGRDADSYQGLKRRLFQGRALVVVRTSGQGGAIRLSAKSSGLAAATVTLQAKKPAAARPVL